MSYATFFCPAFTFAHLARCAAAIFLEANADMVRLGFIFRAWSLAALLPTALPVQVLEALINSRFATCGRFGKSKRGAPTTAEPSPRAPGSSARRFSGAVFMMCAQNLLFSDGPAASPSSKGVNASRELRLIVGPHNSARSLSAAASSR